MAKDLVTILPDYDEKVGNLKATALAVRDAESAGYAHYMAKMLELSQAQREENRKLAEIRKQRHGIDPHAQQPSTLAILARPKEDDEKHWLRPLVDCQIRKKDGTIDVGERAVTIEEISHIESIRRRPKNSVGQSEKTGAGEERKEAARNAYLFAPGFTLEQLTLAERQKLQERTPCGNATPVAEPVLPSQEKRRPLAGRFFHWLWKHGFPVQNVTKKQLSVDEADQHD
jgi:hypothetical protein